MPGLSDVTPAWLVWLASVALLASAWRLHDRLLALFGLAALTYFFVWTHLFAADELSPIKTAQYVGEAIWLDLDANLHHAILFIHEIWLGWVLVLAMFLLLLGMSLFWVLKRSMAMTRQSAQTTDRRSVLVETTVVLGRLLIGIGVAGLLMIIIDRTGHDIDLAQVLAAMLGESRLGSLLVVTAGSIGLAMMTPGFPAYLIAVALFGSALRTVGVDGLTANLYLFAICVSTWLIKLAPTRGLLPFRLRPAN